MLNYLRKYNNLFLIFIIIYLILRAFFINVNFTEWGDTFRMIRAAEFMTHGAWPWDEKRWPAYSLLLVPGIWTQSVILWGRILSLVATLGTLYFVYKFYIKLSLDFKGLKLDYYALIAVILLAVNPTFAYWGFRVMADPVFAFLVIFYSYLFITFYQKSLKDSLKNKEIVLALLLLVITMTRLEGLFMFFGSVAFFCLAKNAKRIILYSIPQILIYFPWTVYAKFLYQGPVSNDYLKEAETFVFNLDRFMYFFTYTGFILVLPMLVYFLIIGCLKLKNAINMQNKAIWMAYVPVALFILQEFLIGFIWTPSLPRIYTPIIPFLILLTVYGFEHTSFTKNNIKPAVSIFLITIIFAILQYQEKMYFLGASKILFALIIGSSLLACALIFLNKSFTKLALVGLMFFVGLFASAVIINNQKDIYKSVLQSIYLSQAIIESQPSTTFAYSDETGNTSWYLKNNVYYLDPGNEMENLDEQYELLTSQGVDYLIVTNEFNRGSQFLDPKDDPRYQIVGVFNVPIYDLAENMLDYLGLELKEDVPVFITKVYQVL